MSGEPPYGIFDAAFFDISCPIGAEILAAHLARFDAETRQVFIDAPLNDAGNATCLLLAYGRGLRRMGNVWEVCFGRCWRRASFEGMMRIAQLTLYLRTLVMAQADHLTPEHERLLVEWAHERRRLTAIIHLTERKLASAHDHESKRIPKPLRIQRGKRRYKDLHIYDE